MRVEGRAVFLDRDGVLIEDVDLLTDAAQIRTLPGAAEALQGLKGAGFRLVVVSNQTVVARGMATERDVETINCEVERRLRLEGAPPFDGFYFCPHHPKATLEQYRLDCDCRKPRAGLLRRAAGDLKIDLMRSFMVGDRITDIAAGKTAGCRTALVQTGRHAAPPIVTSEPFDPALKADWTGPDLSAAAQWILGA